MRLAVALARSGGDGGTPQGGDATRQSGLMLMPVKLTRWKRCAEVAEGFDRYEPPAPVCGICSLVTVLVFQTSEARFDSGIPLQSH